MIDVSAAIKLDLRKQRRLKKLGEDLRPAFRELRKPVLDDQRDHRKKKAGPNGKWPGLAVSTRKRYRQMRAAGRKPPRGLLGRLTTGYVVRVERRRMSVSSRVPWSNIHKKGGRAGRALLPKRDFLYISPRLRRQVCRTMVRLMVRS